MPRKKLKDMEIVKGFKSKNTPSIGNTSKGVGQRPNSRSTNKPKIKK